MYEALKAGLLLDDERKALVLGERGGGYVMPDLTADLHENSHVAVVAGGASLETPLQLVEQAMGAQDEPGRAPHHPRRFLCP